MDEPKPVEGAQNAGPDVKLNKDELAEGLHSKRKLATIRSFQGDMASAIEQKHESVLTIVSKAKERQQVEGTLPIKPKTNAKAQVFIFFLSVLFIAGTGGAGFYVYTHFLNTEVLVQPVERELVSFSSIASVASLGENNIIDFLSDAKLVNGVNLIKINDLVTAQQFFDKIQVSPPPGLIRVMDQEYALGSYVAPSGTSYFLIIKVVDFGVGFGAMIEWENVMPEDLSFLNLVKVREPVFEDDSVLGTSTIANSTTSSTVVTFIDDGDVETAPLPPSRKTWRDRTIENKDMRVYADQNGAESMAYSFLDKDTILITTSAGTIADLSTQYNNRTFTK